MTGVAATVLATGTDAGKTWVACALLRRARALGRSVRAVKPVMSGFSAAELAESDVGRLAAACGRDLTEETVRDMCLHAFAPALAPNVAARRAGVALDAEEMRALVHCAAGEGADLLLVEGAGGVLSPLTDACLNADLAADLGFPVLLATASYLGAVTHTLTALEACARRGVRVAVIAVTQPTPDAGAPQELADELARWTDVPCVVFPHGDDTGADAALALLAG